MEMKDLHLILIVFSKKETHLFSYNLSSDALNLLRQQLGNPRILIISHIIK